MVVRWIKGCGEKIQMVNESGGVLNGAMTKIWPIDFIYTLAITGALAKLRPAIALKGTSIWYIGVRQPKPQAIGGW